MSRAVSRLLAPPALLAALLFMILGPIATPGASHSIATRALVYTYDDSQSRTPSQVVSEAANPTGTADRATKAIVDLHQPASGMATVFAAEDTGAAAGDTAAGIRDTVNPLGGTNNCTYCAVATDRTLAGSPASALDVPPGVKGMPISVVSDVLGGIWKPVSGLDEIEQELTGAGDGARGVV